MRRRQEAEAPGHRPHPLEKLQRSLGNAAVARLVQRADAPAEDEVRPRRDGAAPEVGPSGGPLSTGLSTQIDAKRGGGSALETGTRSSMESAFGASFADVRLHTDAEAHALNRSVGAKAFTTGSDIFFGAGSSPSDSGLLAHELTHVVQQGGKSGGGPLTVGPAGDRHEQAADVAAAAVTSGGSVARLAEEEAEPAQRQVERAPTDEIVEEEPGSK